MLLLASLWKMSSASSESWFRTFKQIISSIGKAKYIICSNIVFFTCILKVIQLRFYFILFRSILLMFFVIEALSNSPFQNRVACLPDFLSLHFLGDILVYPDYAEKKDLLLFSLKIYYQIITKLIR